jgi:uncharacterized protein (TIGR02099 family)
VSSPLRRRIRHARRLIGYGSLVALILLALLVSVFNQLLPAVESHPEQIARWLSERVGEPVSFSHARGEWTRRGPRFVFDDLHVGKGANVLAVGRAQLQVAAFTGWLPGHPLTELKIRELSLALEQHEDGRWQVIGLPGQGAAGDPFDRLEGFGELQIEKAGLAVRSARHKFSMTVPRIDARLRVNGPRLLVGVSAWVKKDGNPVSAVLDFDRDHRGGLLWAGGKGIVLADWAPLLEMVGVRPEGGHGELQLWTRLRDQRIDQVTLRADLAEARLRSTAPLRAADGRLLSTQVGFDRLRADARMDIAQTGWRLSAPRLNLKRGENVAHLDGLMVEGGSRFALRGRELDLSPLAAMLALSDRLPGELRLFLLQSNPQAVLRDVEIHGRRNGQLRGTLRLEQLSLQPYGQRPGLSGLAGRVRFDEHGGVMRVDSTPVTVDWPVALHHPEVVRLAGSLSAWRSGAGWNLGTGALGLRGEDFNAQVRMALGFQGDGSLPTLDLAGRIDGANVQTAKRFWILHKMPPATVRWLDTALVAGEVQDGRIAIGGDLDDWPFSNRGGAFDARAHVADATVKFSPEWPQGEHMEIDLDFFGPGFSLAGSGQLLGNRVASVTGGIEAFHEPWLKLDIAAESEGEKLRQLLLASPLQKEYGEHMRALSISGAAKVGVQLYLPLHEGLGDQHIDGTVELAKASLADSRWNIAFTGVNGRTSFNERGFATDNLAVLLQNEPGTFNLRVGDATGDAAVAALATLEGHFSASTLVDRDEDLAWLKPWLKGAAQWRIAVGVPKTIAGRTGPSHLRVASDLAGVELTLPAPLAKPANAALALEVQAPLPLYQGELNLRLGNLMRLRAQMHEKAPMAGSIVFGDGAFAPYPTQGLVVRGRVPLLDSTGWVAFAGGDDKQGSANSGSVRNVDVQADTLLFLDRRFADTRLQLDHAAAQTSVTLKGKGIEGSVEIPSETARGVTGRFATLHLPSDDSSAGTQPAIADSGVAVEDPSSLPPLRFSIADLRIGSAQLGKAELQTSPIPSGLRIDKFSTRAKNLSMDAAGEWLRSAGGSRSNLKVDFTAASLGQMLDTLGYGNMVEGGKTHATLSGSWPGSPGAFSLATLSGTLKAEVGEGRMLDVEPGGSGRVLGLLSLAEIPRRLTLDFSDFFKKGFAFNTVKGDFTFSDGVARTDNMHIDGPAAEIRISGNTQMRDKLYDQRVEVLPKAGGVLPVVGFLIGGPAGAAAGAVAQGMFNKPLKQTTRVVYHVTGPWEKPVVTVVEKGPAKGDATSGSNPPPAATAMEKR